jgi:hypothetical protein
VLRALMPAIIRDRTSADTISTIALELPSLTWNKTILCRNDRNLNG